MNTKTLYRLEDINAVLAEREFLILRPGGSSTGRDEFLLGFISKAGDSIRFVHYADCCESVNLVEVDRDFADAAGARLLSIDVETNEAEEEGPESGTWTFYRLNTSAGTFVLRFLGTSNGYYSESVDIVGEFAAETPAPPAETPAPPADRAKGWVL